MYLLSRLFLFLTKSADQRDKERNDAYLAEATDNLRPRIPHAEAGSSRHSSWFA